MHDILQNKKQFLNPFLFDFTKAVQKFMKNVYQLRDQSEQWEFSY